MLMPVYGDVDVVGLLQQESVDICMPIKMLFASFFGKEKPFPEDRMIWKPSLDGATIVARMPEKNIKNVGN